jgi:histone deacetylase 1/2
MLVLGGGGYTLRNVARCWAYETSILADHVVPTEMPRDDKYIEYYGPEYKIHVPISNMENLNTKDELKKKTETLVTHIRENVHAVAPNISHYSGNELFNTVNGMYSSESQAIREELRHD